MDLSRRALFRGRVKSDSASEIAIRMPWMLSNEAFTDQCTRCAKCTEACPEQVIEKGDGGFPSVNFESGECTFCGDCVDVCPEPIFKDKEETPWNLKAVIAAGKSNHMAVSFDGVCMAHQGVVCQSCKDVCDVRAISMAYKTATPVPEISVDSCTGCGACVSVCPTSAIQMSDKESVTVLTQSESEQQESSKPKGVDSNYAFS